MNPRTYDTVRFWLQEVEEHSIGGKKVTVGNPGPNHLGFDIEQKDGTKVSLLITVDDASSTEPRWMKRRLHTEAFRTRLARMFSNGWSFDRLAYIDAELEAQLDLVRELMVRVEDLYFAEKKGFPER